MKIVGSKAEVRKILDQLIKEQPDWLSEKIIRFIHQKILKQKIRFPILEHVAEILHKIIPEKQQLSFLQKIIDLDEIGSYTLAGKILQLRSSSHLKGSFSVAEKFILQGDKWYVCDIIGERVFGHDLLTVPEKTIPVLIKNSKHQNKWMVRTIGVAAHYAIKKGLKKKYVEEVFELLLSLANTTEFHTKKGIGWAAKTTAKFYPDIIKKHEGELKNNSEIKQWFRTKLKIGLGRSFKYASKYNS